MENWVNAVANCLGYSKVKSPEFGYKDESIQELANGTYGLFYFLNLDQAKQVARYAIAVAGGKEPMPEPRKIKPRREAKQPQAVQMSLFDFMS